MEELVRAVVERLPPGSTRLAERADGLEACRGGWRVGLAEGGGLDADLVILAAEAHQSGRLLRYVDPSLAQLLGEIPYASSAIVSLGYARETVRHPLDGFGFVVPRSEGRPLLACTFSSVKYPGRAPAGRVLMRVFLGGVLDTPVLDADDAALAELAHRELSRVLGVTSSPLLTRVVRHPASMPQYLVGHLARVEAIERALAARRGLALAGGAYHGVGIADCVRSGEVAAEGLLARP